MADQNFSMSDKIATLVGHFVRPIICCNIWLCHLLIKFNFLICYSFECTFLCMSDQIFLLFDQNDTLVRHVSFQGKKNYLQPYNRDMEICQSRFFGQIRLSATSFCTNLGPHYLKTLCSIVLLLWTVGVSFVCLSFK